ncbi:MAG TPA: metallophosphoesterase family protein [Devosia sp.]
MARLSSLLGNLLGRVDGLRNGLPRLIAAERPPLIYAVGDVHGCLDPLKALEARILADAADISGEKWLVMLGDYVDRGPLSAQVLDHLIGAPLPGFRRICLRGNHDAAMLAALEDADALDAWLGWGVEPTLASYDMDPAEIGSVTGPGRASDRLQLLRMFIPDEHVAFLRELPVLLSVPGYTFVHAGLRPGIAIERQSDHDLLWIRDEFLKADHDFGAVVIHGHTPADEPFLSARRVGIDTACFASGRLTAVRVADDGLTLVG